MDADDIYEALKKPDPTRRWTDNHIERVLEDLDREDLIRPDEPEIEQSDRPFDWGKAVCMMIVGYALTHQFFTGHDEWAVIGAGIFFWIYLYFVKKMS